MRLFVLAVLAVVFGGSSVASATPIQWTLSSGGNGHYYELFSAPTLLWTDAKAAAEGLGGYLATPTTAEEDAFIALNFISALDGCRCTWIGGFQNLASPDYSEPSGGWEWVTGEPWSYTNWATDEPNDAAVGTGEHHLTYWFGNFWNDNIPETNGYLVEWDMSPTPVPEPNTALLVVAGLIALAMQRSRQATAQR